MKRWISLMLVMCLLTGAVPAAAAQGQTPEKAELTAVEKFQQVLPDYPVGTAALEGTQYSVLGGWIIGVARNPSLRREQTTLLCKAAGGELIPDPDKEGQYLLKPERVPDFSKAAPEAQAEIGSTVGNLLIAYARNPSLARTILQQVELFGLAREIPKEEWPQDLPEGEMPGISGFEMTRLDDTQEGFQCAKAESAASLMIAYARNPRYGDDLVSMYEQAFGPKTRLETVTPAVRAAWIRAASGLMIAYARNPNIMTDPDVVDFVDLFDRYSPIPFAELVSADTCEPEVKAAQLYTLGGLLVGYARNPSLQNDFERIYAHLNPAPELVPLAEREPLVQAAATNVFGLFQIAYARNPALYGTFMKYLADSGLAIELDPDPEADLQNKWQYVQPDLSLPEVQAARMETLSAQLIGYARNPNLVEHFDSAAARSYGFYSGMAAPLTPQDQSAQANTLVGMTIAYARNPSLVDKMLDIVRTMSIPPLPMGEGYTIDFETETMTVLPGYRVFNSSGEALGQSVDLAGQREKGMLDLRVMGPLHAEGFLDEANTRPIGRERIGQLHIPQDGKWPAAPEEQPSVLTGTWDTVILTPMEPPVTPKDGENRVQYSCDGGKTWQDSNEFTGLEPDTDYTFTVRCGGRRYMDCSVAGGAQEALYAAPLSPSPAGLQVEAHTKKMPVQVGSVEHPDGSRTEQAIYDDESAGNVTITPDGGKSIVSIDAQNNTMTIVASPSAPGRRTQVLIPAGNKAPGLAAVVVRPDGTEETVRRLIISDIGFYLTVDETVELKFVDRSKRFDDLSGHWGANAVDYVTSREMFAGVSDHSFAPNLTMTRGMLVQVLYNLEGKPDTAAGKKFGDVTEKNWYADAVAWAANRKVVSGYPDGNFGGEDLVNREQLAVMLYNFAGRPAVEPGKLDFADASRVSAYAETAIQWAAQNGIMSGDGTNLNPQDNATRAEAASMLMNFVNNIYG